MWYELFAVRLRRYLTWSGGGALMSRGRQTVAAWALRVYAVYTRAAYLARRGEPAHRVRMSSITDHHKLEREHTAV
jgi:hypothetical protein